MSAELGRHGRHRRGTCDRGPGCELGRCGPVPSVRSRPSAATRATFAFALGVVPRLWRVVLTLTSGPPYHRETERAVPPGTITSPSTTGTIRKADSRCPTWIGPHRRRRTTERRPNLGLGTAGLRVAAQVAPLRNPCSLRVLQVDRRHVPRPTATTSPHGSRQGHRLVEPQAP